MNVHVISSSQKLGNLIEVAGIFGPILTLRNLNLKNDINKDLLNLNNWNYTLGDLELF